MLSWNELIDMAEKQSEPQRLLFVFSKFEVREGEDPKDEAADFSIEPVMYNDKPLEDISGFDALVKETQEADFHWDVVFVAGLGGSNGELPSAETAEEHLQKMIQAIYQGQVHHFAVYNTSGEKVELIKTHAH